MSAPLTHYQPLDALTVKGRPAVFMWFAFNNRNYVRVRFTDTQERKTVSVLDIDASPDISALALRCIEAVRETFAALDERLDAIDAWDPLDSDDPAETVEGAQR